jgi:hypothetical protein
MVRSRALKILCVFVATGAFTIGGAGVPAQAAEEKVSDFFSTDGASLQRLVRQQQEVVASCMKTKGFEYKVVGLGEIADALGEIGDPEKFAEKYGYGVSTLINPDKAGKPPTPDANEAIIAKMSAGQKKAYYKALSGTDQAPTQQLVAGGCVGESTKKLFSSLTSLQALGPKFEDLQKRVNNNAKVLAAMKNWSGCMKEAGFTFRDDTEPTTSLQKELNGLAKGGVSTGGANPFGGNVDVSKLDPTKLRALQKKELTINKTDRSCTKKHLKERDAIAAVEEKKFIEQNRAVLEKTREIFGKKK